MTIPGIGSVVASVVLASIGDIARFPSAYKLSSYFGLTPRVRQSGDHPARHGHISKQGNADARKMLVEAAWSAKTAPGPLRAFFNRVQKKRGGAARGGCDGAQARGDDLARSVERKGIRLRSPGVHGDEASQGGADRGRAEGLRQGGLGPRLLDQGEIRDREAGYVARAEQAYERMVAAWKQKPEKSVAG